MTLPNDSSLISPSITLHERYIEATIMSTVLAVGFVGNLSLWLIILRHKSLKTPSNALILSLSMADLLVTVINMPLMIVTLGKFQKNSASMANHNTCCSFDLLCIMNWSI